MTEKRHWVRLTRFCNNNCIFCLDKECQDGTYIPYNIIVEDLKKGIKDNASRAILSGGEATLHPQFFDIISAAKNINYAKIQVITNGRMFAYKKFLNTAIEKGVDEITFSIHGHKKELHDYQTGIEGSFAQTMKGLLQALNTKKLIVNVDIVINQSNYKFLPEIVKFFNNLGIWEFDLLQVVPFGNAWENKEKVFYDLDDIAPYLHKTIKFAVDKGIKLWTNRFPPEYLEGCENLIQDPAKIFDEVRGRTEIFNDYILHNKLMPCYGERCSYCFMNRFCKTLISLKENLTKETNTLTQIGREKHRGTEKLSIVDCRLSIENSNNQQITTNNILRGTEAQRHKGLKKFEENFPAKISQNIFCKETTPPCIPKGRLSLSQHFYPLDIFNKSLITNKHQNLSTAIDISKFAKYFIKYLYKVKSLRCKECKVYSTCDGLHINYIRNFGFGILEPIPISKTEKNPTKSNKNTKLHINTVNIPHNSQFTIHNSQFAPETLFQNPSLNKLLHHMKENILSDKLIYNGWGLEEIYPYGNSFIALQFNQSTTNEKTIICVGTPDKNQKSFLHTNKFNLYTGFNRKADGKIIILAKYLSKLLLKISSIDLLLEDYEKNNILHTSENISPQNILLTPSQTKIVPLEQPHKLWVASSCDLNCIFCSLKDIGEMQAANNKKLDYHKKWLDIGIKQNKNMLQISGFEILNYKYIFNIIEYAKDIGYKKFTVFTTAFKLYDKIFADEFIDILGNNFWLNIPIYGHTDKLHDSITQTAGSFKKLTQGLHNLLGKCNPQNIMMTSVVIKQNYKKIGKLIDFLKTLGLDNFQCRIPYPITESNNDRYNYVSISLSDTFSAIIVNSPTYGVDVVYPCIFFTYFEKYGLSSFSNFKILLKQMPFLSIFLPQKKNNKSLLCAPVIATFPSSVIATSPSSVIATSPSSVIATSPSSVIATSPSSVIANPSSSVIARSETTKQSHTSIADSEYKEKQLTCSDRIGAVICPYTTKCILSNYCTKKIYRKYLQIFGSSEFVCITKERYYSINK